MAKGDAKKGPRAATSRTPRKGSRKSAKKRATRKRDTVARKVVAEADAKPSRSAKQSGPLKDARRELFCTYCLREDNPTQAAIAAGYSAHTASQQASRLLNDVQIKRRIMELLRKRRHRILKRKRDILRECAEIADASGVDVMACVVESGGDMARLVELLREIPAGRHVRKVKLGVIVNEQTGEAKPYPKEIELYDAQQARRMINEMCGYNKPVKHELGGEGGGPIPWALTPPPPGSVEEWEQLVATMREAEETAHAEDA